MTPVDRARLQLRFREFLKLEARLRIVLFASQGQAANAIVLPLLKASAAALPNVGLVIRPHPYESSPLVRLMNPGVRVSRAFSARDAIQAADVLITHSSFMAVEAALLCCPVILVSPDAVPSLMPLAMEGLARWARTSEELRRALEDLLENGDSRVRVAQERFRNEQAKVAGMDRAADVIAELAQARLHSR
jgi:CDP-glycerol glycerophosphotransferase (TagB/SpsB family)